MVDVTAALAVALLAVKTCQPLICQPSAAAVCVPRPKDHCYNFFVPMQLAWTLPTSCLKAY